MEKERFCFLFIVQTVCDGCFRFAAVTQNACVEGIFVVLCKNGS